MAVDYQVKLDAGTILIGVGVISLAGIFLRKVPAIAALEKDIAAAINPGIKDTPDDPWPGFGVNQPPAWTAGLGGGVYWLWDYFNG